MTDAARIERLTARAGELPAAPAIVTELLRLTEDPSVDMEQICDVVQRDPALTAKILRISNSPYYGLKQHVGTLKLALVVLGIWEVRNIVLGVSVFDALRNAGADTMLTTDYYQHSFVVASLCKKVATELRLTSQGEAFVCGVLHDIGKLILVRQMGKPYIMLYKQSGGAGKELCAAELDKLGFTHADAGAALAVKWNFPKTLTDSLWLHHAGEGMALDQAKDPLLAALVRVSNQAARYDWNSEEPEQDPPTGATEAWAFLDTARAPIPDADRMRILGKFMGEIAEMPLPTI